MIAAGCTVTMVCSSPEHATPRRVATGTVRPRKRQRRLGEHRQGGDERQLHDDDRGDVGQEVARTVRHVDVPEAWAAIM